LFNFLLLINSNVEAKITRITIHVGNSGIEGEGEKVEVIDGFGKSERAWVGDGEDVVVAGDVEFDEGGREL
jgi:hypothetical protein